MSYKTRSNSSKRIEARIRYNDATETAIIPVSWQQVHVVYGRPLGSLASGSAAIAKTINNAILAKEHMEEKKRHNRKLKVLL